MKKRTQTDYRIGDLGAFANALREYLGLGPLERDGNVKLKPDAVRFYIEPWPDVVRRR